ncbi:MAG TPA: ferritin-like protein [Candidatus Solibacter sp.]|nr:ferritin-like protein [Candidatus Solibacter sp.]
MSPTATVRTRSDLLKLLCEAAELEHGIACSYLYAGFSLKRDVSEGGITWDELQKVRRWAAQLYFIASQEMLHLALVWNITTAIGGTPYYLRPNFPQNTKYYPLKVPIELEPFGVRSLRRFILYEHPEKDSPTLNLKELLRFPGDDNEEFEFGTVGELYRLIESGFRNIPEKELFIGSPAQQMTTDLVHFPDLVPVNDRASALRAIEEITEQGEGRVHHRESSHFAAFVDIFQELQASGAQGSSFLPARPAMRNPCAALAGGYGANANPIDNKLASQVAALFDSTYSLMLRMLAWSFEFDAAGVEQQLKSFCSAAIDLMPRVLLPLGEGLMLMPAGDKYPGKTAGPGFGLTRHVTLPQDAKNARQLCRERFQELAALAAGLLKNPMPNPVKAGCAHLQRIAENFEPR